jgi:hypothetical protein
MLSEVFAKWVPRMLTDAHKTQKMASDLTFLERNHDDDSEFVNHIIRVTGDETWVSFVKVETKEQSNQCMNTHSPNKPKKFKQTLYARNLMETVFLDRKGKLMVDFMQQGTALTSEVYCETQKEVCRAIQNRRLGMLTSDVMFLHNNARPHTAARTRTAVAFQLGVV